MRKSFIEHKFIIKELPTTLSSLQRHDTSKLHECAFNWSDRCAHCEIGFDELKQKMLSSTESSAESLNDLRMKTEESLTKLEG